MVAIGRATVGGAELILWTCGLLRRILLCWRKGCYAAVALPFGFLDVADFGCGSFGLLRFWVLAKRFSDNNKRCIVYSFICNFVCHARRGTFPTERAVLCAAPQQRAGSVDGIAGASTLP